MVSLRRESYPEVSPRQGKSRLQAMEPFQLSPEAALGLRLADWPGRNQVFSCLLITVADCVETSADPAFYLISDPDPGSQINADLAPYLG